ncbi:hypothetical protein N7533_013286, partial [Penicillium manginii]|uniref:uncharacterized protein n=1 Tax=Penicillium manginii TaxID=203109 RepID=UPI0025494102
HPHSINQANSEPYLYPNTITQNVFTKQEIGLTNFRRDNFAVSIAIIAYKLVLKRSRPIGKSITRLDSIKARVIKLSESNITILFLTNSLSIYQKIATYFDHILDFWSSLVRSDQYLMKKINQNTVYTL